MNKDGRPTKRKIVKAGVELSVQSTTGKYEHIGYYPNKLEALQFAKRYHSNSNFRIMGVRVDATPLVLPTRDTEKQDG